MSTRPSVNLFCLIARNARVAVVFRRGPARLVQLLRWDLSNDQFEKGQWFNGRIYEHCCDLSPSGNYLIYWAGNHKPPYYHWTAISKPPYLTAIELWPNGGSAGGGIFVNEKQVQLAFSFLRRKPQEQRLPVDIETLALKAGFNSELGPVLEARLILDGWLDIQKGVSTLRSISKTTLERNIRLVRRLANNELDATDMKELSEYLSNAKGQKRKKETMERPFSPIDIKHKQSGTNYLEMRTLGLHEVGGPTHVTEYRVLSTDGSVSLDLQRTDWADWDKNGDLLYAKSGCLFRVAGNRVGETMPLKLIDLTNATFEPLEAPEDFKHW